MSAGSPTYPAKTIAKLLMLTERRVQQLSKEGVIPRAERGRYELGPAVQGYVRFLRDRAIGGESVGGEADDKARLTRARADIAQFEAQRLNGELVECDEVQKTWADIVGRFRARCLAIASKAAPMVAVEETVEACNEIIETFVHEALAEIAATEVVGSGAAGDTGTDSAKGSSAAAQTNNIGVGRSF